MKSFCKKELVQGVKGVFEFHLTGKEPGVWHLDFKNNAGELKIARYISNEKIFIQEKLIPWLTYNPVLC